MLKWFRERSANAFKANELYGAVVAAARQPAFYRAYGVPDTLNGRYEMIVLVLFQLLERLRSEGTAAEEQSRLTLEAFFTDMDDCMREIGVGDLAVPKKVKKAAAGFYERAKAYRQALAGNDGAAMAKALSTFINAEAVLMAEGGPAQEDPVCAAAAPAPTGQGDTDTFAVLAAHALRQRDALAAADAAAVLAGHAFIAPEPT